MFFLGGVFWRSDGFFWGEGEEVVRGSFRGSGVLAFKGFRGFSGF